MDIKRKNSLPVVMLVSISLLILAFISSCSNAPTPYLIIGTNVWPGYEPLYLAKKLGYFKKSRIHLVEHPSASSVITAFNNQTINAAAVTLDEALLLKQSGHDITIVLALDISHGADAIVAHPKIKTIAELKNKRIAVENNALGAFMLSRALEKAHLKLSDVKLIKTEVNHHEKVYLQGKADAVVTFEPVRTQLLNLGAQQLFDSRQIPGEIVDVLIVNTNYLKKHPNVINTLINNWFITLDYIQKNPQRAYVQISQHLRLSPEDTEKSYNGLLLSDRHQNKMLLQRENDNSLYKSSTKLREFMLRVNLLEKRVDINSLFSGYEEILQNNHDSASGK